MESLPPEKSAASFTTLHATNRISMLCSDYATILLGGDLFTSSAIPIGMYCPKCEKRVKKERLEELEKELKERFDDNSLGRGLCPVCGTTLIHLPNGDD